MCKPIEEVDVTGGGKRKSQAQKALQISNGEKKLTTKDVNQLGSSSFQSGQRLSRETSWAGETGLLLQKIGFGPVAWLGIVVGVHFGSRIALVVGTVVAPIITVAIGLIVQMRR